MTFLLSWSFHTVIRLLLTQGTLFPSSNSLGILLERWTFVKHQSSTYFDHPFVTVFLLKSFEYPLLHVVSVPSDFTNLKYFVLCLLLLLVTFLFNEVFRHTPEVTENDLSFYTYVSRFQVLFLLTPPSLPDTPLVKDLECFLLSLSPRLTSFIYFI